MDLSARYRPAGARIIHEAFEDEVVVVNLDSGRYYSAQQAGADMWQLMMAGQDVGEIASTLEAHYDASADALAAAAHRFFEDARRESLLIAADGAADGTSVPTLADRGRRPLGEPRLQVYTDMEDLLLLDPIHEVDSAGWPTAGTAGTDGSGRPR